MHLQCTVCKTKGYVTTKNKATIPDKLKMNKYCKTCKKHTEHKEVK